MSCVQYFFHKLDTQKQRTSSDEQDVTTAHIKTHREQADFNDCFIKSILIYFFFLCLLCKANVDKERATFVPL